MFGSYLVGVAATVLIALLWLVVQHGWQRVFPGALTDPELLELLQLDSEETIYDLFTWEEAAFEFLDDELPEEELIPMNLDVTFCIVEGMRRFVVGVGRVASIRECVVAEVHVVERHNAPQRGRVEHHRIVSLDHVGLRIEVRKDALEESPRRLQFDRRLQQPGDREEQSCLQGRERDDCACRDRVR